MIRFELLRDAGVLILEPKSALSAEDFREISGTIDPYIREKGKLTGLLIEAPSFPGWDSFGALIEHLKFVYDHHRNIDRVAAVTDNAFLKSLLLTSVRNTSRASSTEIPAFKKAPSWREK